MIVHHALVAQWIEHQTSNLGVAGSSPAGGRCFVARAIKKAGSRVQVPLDVRVAQWIARLPPKQKVAGSNPASDVLF